MGDRSEQSDSIVVHDKAIADKMAQIRSQGSISIESFRQRNAQIMMSCMKPERFRSFVDGLIDIGKTDPRVACFLMTMFVGKPKEMVTGPVSAIQMEELRALINSRLIGEPQVLDVASEEA